jgi:mannose-6-phosphate isomerase-like protein (cupin superfamily)
MVEMAPGADRGDGKQTLIDLACAAAMASGNYANFPLTEVDDHIVRMSVMTEPFYWRGHPDSDETFLVIEGEVLLQTETERVELGPGQLYTVPAGVAHVTSPCGARSVNITVEKTGMLTERLPEPPADSDRRRTATACNPPACWISRRTRCESHLDAELRSCVRSEGRKRAFSPCERSSCVFGGELRAEGNEDPARGRVHGATNSAACEEATKTGQTGGGHGEIGKRESCMAPREDQQPPEPGSWTKELRQHR